MAMKLYTAFILLVNPTNFLLQLLFGLVFSVLLEYIARAPLSSFSVFA